MTSLEQSIPEILRDHADTRPNETLFSFGKSDDAIHEVTYREVRERSERWAAALRRVAVQHGDRVAIMMPTCLDYVAAVFASMAVGAIAVPLFAPGADSKKHRLDAAVLGSLPTVIATLPGLRESVESFVQTLALGGRCAVVTAEDLDDERLPLGSIRSPAIAFLQYTSGSTSTPKAVQVTHANIVANSASIGSIFGHGEGDRVRGVCWLPLHHDMGLIGSVFHVLLEGGSCHLYDASQFLLRPANWLRLISATKAHTSGGPNFGFNWCVDHVKDSQIEGIDLSSWRVAYNGSEPISSQTIERFAERFTPNGFRRESFLPCYGLAEFTLLVTGSHFDHNRSVDVIDAGELAQGRVVDAVGTETTLVSSGEPAPNTLVRVVDLSTGEPVAERSIGTILISGPSRTLGYWGLPEESRATTIELEGETYFNTGDLGYLRQGELVVLGRASELIVIRGRNLVPHDIEETVAEAIDLRSGLNCVAGSQTTGAESTLVIICETPKGATDFAAATSTIRRAIASTHGVQPQVIAFVPRRSIPTTTSGKKQRAAAIEMLADNDAVLLFVDELPSSGGERRPRPDLANPFEPPQTPMEQTIAEIWSEVLGIDRVGRSDHFLDLGGDSIGAVDVASRLGIAFGQDIRLSSLFEAHTIALVAEVLVSDESEDEEYDEIEL